MTTAPPGRLAGLRDTAGGTDQGGAAAPAPPLAGGRGGHCRNGGGHCRPDRGFGRRYAATWAATPCRRHPFMPPRRW